MKAGVAFGGESSGVSAVPLLNRVQPRKRSPRIISAVHGVRAIVILIRTGESRNTTCVPVIEHAYILKLV